MNMIMLREAQQDYVVLRPAYLLLGAFCFVTGLMAHSVINYLIYIGAIGWLTGMIIVALIYLAGIGYVLGASSFSILRIRIEVE